MKLLERPENMTRHFRALLVILFAPIFILWAWNAFMPEIFGLAEIKYKHALALLILVGLGGALLRPRARRHLARDNNGEEA